MKLHPPLLPVARGDGDNVRGSQSHQLLKANGIDVWWIFELFGLCVRECVCVHVCVCEGVCMCACVCKREYVYVCEYMCVSTCVCECESEGVCMFVTKQMDIQVLHLTSLSNSNHYEQ